MSVKKKKREWKEWRLCVRGQLTCHVYNTKAAAKDMAEYCRTALWVKRFAGPIKVMRVTVREK